jgi:hypothetical protein
MRLAGLKHILKIHLQLQLIFFRRRNNGAIMAVGSKDENKEYFWDRKIDFLEVILKYGSLVVFIQLDPTEILKLVGQSPLAVFDWVGETSPGVFGVFVGYVSSHSRPNKGLIPQPSMILYQNSI